MEERLLFFQKGIAPGKNADAIRKVLDQLSLEQEEDQEDQEMEDAPEPVLPLIDAEPTKKKKKSKKRKLEEVEMDGDDGSEGEHVKKVKLSKEEKKALKKEKKRERKEKEAKEAAEVSRAPWCPPTSYLIRVRTHPRRRKKRKGKRKIRLRGRKKGRASTDAHSPRPIYFISFPFAHIVTFLHICKLCFVHVITLLWSRATLPIALAVDVVSTKMMVYCYKQLRSIISTRNRKFVTVNPYASYVMCSDPSPRSGYQTPASPVDWR